MNETSTQSPYYINDLETLRAIADPTRVQILEILQVKPGSVREVAAKMGLAASKLYYHFNALEKLGLIEVKETHMVANLMEKLYLARIDRLEISPELFSFAQDSDNENLIAMFRSTLNTTLEDISRSMQARSIQLNQGQPEHPRHVVIHRDVVRMSDEKADQMIQKICQLLEEFEASASDNPEDPVFAMTTAFYPSFYFPDSEKKQE